MWASKKVREQREAIVIHKHSQGWCVKDISTYIGIPSGSVSHIIKKYQDRRSNDIPTTQE
jgi:transposase